MFLLKPKIPSRAGYIVNKQINKKKEGQPYKIDELGRDTLCQKARIAEDKKENENTTEK